MTNAEVQLPDDASLLKEMVRHLIEDKTKLEQQMERMEHHLRWLIRQRFGHKSDKLNPDQLLLIAKEMLEAPAVDPAQQKKPEQAKKPAKKRKGHGRRPIPRDLPRKTIHYPVPLEELVCGNCDVPKKKIGEQKQEQLERVPAQWYVIEHVQDKLACPKCGSGVTTAEKPPQPIEKGLGGPGLLADVIVYKYEYHLPLNRLEKKYAREGVPIARSTMAGWMAECAWALKPICKVMRDSLLVNSKVIHTDDTPVPVLERGRKHTKTGRLWIYVGDENAPFTLFDYTASRRRDGPIQFLGDFAGHLQADAYAGYDCLYAGKRIIEIACWAHARRYYTDAQTADPQRAFVAVEWIGKLYDIEDEARPLDHDARAALRQDKARPLLSKLKEWLDGEQKKLVPKSPMAQAINYTLSNWVALTRYCEDGRLDIDNNEAERQLRRVAIGRKNWMHAGSDNGGHTAAILYSICASAVRHGLDPWAYIRDLLVRVGIEKMSNVRELLPDRWTPLFETELAKRPMSAPSVRAASAN